MMEKCFDEGTLQAFLDNELSSEKSQAVARHIAVCDACAFLMADIEEETAIAFTALEQEFNTLVPTMRLWTKINESIETQSRNRSVWQKLSAFVSGLNLMNPQIVAFGSLMLIVGIVSLFIVLKKENVSSDVIAKKPPIISEQTTAENEKITPSPVAPTVLITPQIEQAKTKIQPQIRAEIANYVEPKRKTVERISESNHNPDPSPVISQYVDGEESYVKTIARLEKTVNQSKDEVLKPSARFSYEKDLAVVNDTISKMKQEVKKNPKNDDAKQILFSSYQNKIELLNSVSQRGDLMASLR